MARSISAAVSMRSGMPLRMVVQVGREKWRLISGMSKASRGSALQEKTPFSTAYAKSQKRQLSLEYSCPSGRPLTTRL